MTNKSTIIAATGSYIPEKVVPNSDFLGNDFYDPEGKPFPASNEETIAKFREITGIEERRYVADNIVASDIALFAARDAIDSGDFDPETLDYIIVAHNFGDVKVDNRRSDFVPSIAARVKQRLEIGNPRTIAYDLPFGCPGWLQGVIQANYYIKSGDARRVLIIGAETLSRISDPHDRDSMIYADGAGAVMLEARETSGSAGIIAHAMRSDTLTHANMLRMGQSYGPEHEGNEIYLKMDGHELYKYAVRTVPLVVRECLEKASLGLADIAQVLLHQANDKMDWAILKKLFAGQPIPDYLMPMTISWLGNSSVATLPTLLDLLLKGRLNNHRINSGDNVIFASVGAGMNINAVAYRAV